MLAYRLTKPPSKPEPRVAEPPPLCEAERADDDMEQGRLRGRAVAIPEA